MTHDHPWNLFESHLRHMWIVRGHQEARSSKRRPTAAVATWTGQQLQPQESQEHRKATSIHRFIDSPGAFFALGNFFLTSGWHPGEKSTSQRAPVSQCVHCGFSFLPFLRTWGAKIRESWDRSPATLLLIWYDLIIINTHKELSWAFQTSSNPYTAIHSPCT